MIKKIIKSLKEIGLEPTLEEVIDILWLTNKISKGMSKDIRSSTAQNNVDIQQHSNTTFNKEEIKSLYSNQNNKQNLASQDNNKEIERTINTTNITPINIPTATNASFISSAALQKLRLLKYPTKSKTLSTIDEEQTVRRIIEQDIWSPIMKPIRSHRFDMAFVVDTSDSMFIWKKVIKDFEFSLKSLGAFRSFEKWRICTNSTKPELYKETISTSEQVLPRNYKEISGTSDISKIIFLITDCVSNCWYNGELIKILTEWGKNHIVVIIQVLPESLWVRTALGKMLQVHISAPFSEAKNSQLKTRSINPYDEEGCDCGFPIPTINLEPKPILEWIKLLKGMPNNSVLGIIPFKNPVKLSTLEDPYFEDSFEDCYPKSYVKETLDNFWAASSPKAQRLAILMSAIPFDLDLIFLIQKNLLKESDLSHLAEVFLSGLIKKTKQVKDENKENLSYDFIPQARQLLLDSLSSSDIKALSEQLSFYIERNFGTSFNFLSFIEDPNSLNDIQVNKHTKPFIGITVEVLKRLGSKYNKLVTTLEEKIKLPTSDSSLYSIEIVGDGNYYEDIELVVDKLNKVQNKFKFYLSKEQNSLIGMPFADSYNTGSIFGILRNYRNNLKQPKPYLVAVLNKELSSDKYRYLFGSHEANEGLAAISLYNHKQYTNTSKYLCYYLIRYCLSFIKPTLLSHEETRGCFFDKKLNKQDILKSINSPSLCSDCLTNLKPEFDIELSQSYEKMVEVLKSISPEESQQKTPLNRYKSRYQNIAEQLKLKHVNKFEELSSKMSELKELEERIATQLNPTEFAEWKKENNRFIPLLHKHYLVWNNWKSVNQSEIIDLSYQDLSKYKFHLTHFNFEGVNFQGANLTGLDLTDTKLNNANLSEAILINARLNSAKLINTNLTKAQLSGNNILYGDFSGADFTEADLSSITLENVTLNKVNFTNANLSNAKLIKTGLSETNFTGSYWSNTKLSDVDLNNSIGLDEIKHETLSTLVFSKPQDISFLPATFLSHCQVINKTSVVLIDIDANINFLSGLVNLSNQAQDYYDFQIYSISIPDKSYIKTNFGGQETLPQTFLPLLEKHLSDLPTTLGVDFVCCLTANMIAFEEEDNLHFNFFCADINKDCFAISTYKLIEHAKRANTNLPKAILFLISGMLVAMESKWTIDYHDEIVGCLFDKCIEHSSIVEGLKKMKFEHSECRKKLQNLFQLDAIDKLLALDLSSLINKKHDDEQHIKQLIKKAFELRQTANFEEAIKLYDEVITLCEPYLNSKDIFFIEVLAVSIMNKGLVLNDLGNLEEALTLINKAIKYYEQDSQLNSQRIKAIINKASILTELTRHPESIVSCDEGITIIKSTIKTYNLEEIELLAGLLNNKGQSLHKLNHSSEALSCYNEGISLCENFNEAIPIKLYNVLASLLCNKAIIFNKMDNHAEAEELQDKAVFYYKELINEEGEKWQPSLAQILIGKAISLHNQNKFNEAINCYDSASHLFINLIEKGHFQLKPNLAMVLHNKAGVLKDMSDFSGASIEYDKAIEIRQQLIENQQRIDISADLASSFLAKADLLKELNQLSDAHSLYNKAEDIYSDLVENKHLSQFIPELASVYSHKGNLLTELGEKQQAINYYDNAISYYETLLQEQENQYLSKNLANIFSDKAFTLWDINNKEQAIFYFDKAIEIYRGLIQVETPTTKLQKLFANVLINKANILNEIESSDSIIYCDEAIQHYKILLEKNKEVNVIKAFIGAYNIKSNIAAKSGAIQKAIEYCDEIIRFTRDLEQDIYKNIYQEIVMILTNKAFYLLAINNLSEALNISNEAIDFYNILLQGISSIKTKEHFTLASNLAKTLSRKANTLHKLNRFEDSLNTYNQTIYWQKLCVQSGLNQLTPNLLENLFDDLSIRTIIRTTLNLLDDLVADIKDVFEIVKPFLLLESMEELRWKEYIAQLNNLPISQRDQIYSKVRDSSKDLSLALRITNQIPPEITSTPNPTIVGAIKEDSTVYYTQKDISREFWGDNKNSRRLTNLIYEIVNEKSYGIISIGKALRNVQENFPDFWANEKLFFYPLTDNRPVFPARILVHTNLPITNSSNQDIFLSLNAQKQQIYLLDIPEYKQRKLYCQISINPQFEQTQHLIVTANNKILLPLEITLEINISPSIANFQSCENAYTFLLAGQHFLNFLRKPIKKLKIYFDVNYISKIETHFTLDISKELEKLDFSHVDAKDVISNYKYIDNLVSQLDKIRIQQDLTKTNLVNTTTLETKETLEKELKEWQQEELIWLIRQGKDTWNNWRYRHPEQNIDLSNRQLKLDLGKSKTWLTSFNLSYANLQKCDLSSLELGQANLQGANLSNSILSYANIALTNFTKATLKNVEIENTVVIGVNFTETDFTGSNLTAINLRESKLDKANFSDCNLTKTQIVNSTLSETNFAGSYWNDTKLIDADLTKATGFDKIIHQGTSTLIFTNAIEISNLPTQILQNCKIEFSSKTPKHWLLRTKPHITEINKVYEGREWQYEIVPYEAISQGDIVHFWRNSEQDIYGWGEVIKNPGLPNNFSLQQNQSVKLDVKIKAMSSDSIDKNTIKHYVPEIIDLVKSSSIGLGVIPLPNLQVERLNNLYPLHRMVSPPNLLTVAGRSSASIQSNQQQISTFEYQIVKVDKTGKIIERYRKERQQYIEDLGNGVVLEMVEIPFGSFMMGSPHGEGYDWEKPQHKVEVPAFYMGKYQVTQEQWQSIMGSNPSYFKEDKKLPVEQVSWNDAVEFCKRLSEKTNKIYRLPSEAEWEYACRAGTKTPFAFGETINPNIVNYDGNYPYGQAAKGKYRKKITVVGSLGVANDFGLYDMHGNVWEWCQDEWHTDYNIAPINGNAWGTQHSNNTNRLFRGGSYDLSAYYCRSASRGNSMPGSRHFYLGLRLVMVVSQ